MNHIKRLMGWSLAGLLMLAVASMPAMANHKGEAPWYHPPESTIEQPYYYHNINPVPRDHMTYRNVCYMRSDNYPQGFKLCLNDTIHECTGGQWVTTQRPCVD